MELKRLNEYELTQLYQKEMVYDFPETERKPLGAMLRMMEQGKYDPLAVMEGEELVGYAMMWRSLSGEGALLDYLGVLRGKRCGGLGGNILALLLERYGQLYGEAEAPISENEEENELRRRRIAFYLRNGFRALDYQCALFGVPFQCLYAGPQTDDGVVQRLHRDIYAQEFSPAHMQRYIQLPLLPGEEIHPALAWVEEQDPREYERKVIP